jgi:hypothetical protein
MGEQELFTLAVAITVVVIVGRAVATRFEVPAAVVLVVFGVYAKGKISDDIRRTISRGLDLQEPRTLG